MTSIKVKNIQLSSSKKKEPLSLEQLCYSLIIDSSIKNLKKQMSLYFAQFEKLKFKISKKEKLTGNDYELSNTIDEIMISSQERKLIFIWSGNDVCELFLFGSIKDINKAVTAKFKRLMEKIIHFSNISTQLLNQKHLTERDDLTGLYNQRKLNLDLKTIIDDHQLKHEKFALLFLDVDYFKKVNDNHGHLVGSQLLGLIGKKIKNILRESDYLYRYGGDEFIIILPGVPSKMVFSIAQRLMEIIKKSEFKVDHVVIRNLSISIGLAMYPDDAKDLKNIINYADKMMYQSKNEGRGKISYLGNCKKLSKQLSSQILKEK